MLWNAIAHPFLTALLCCAAPVLAFVSLNAKVFTSRQAAGSLGVAVLFGACLGMAFMYLSLPDIVYAGVSLLFFLTLSQRFFSDVLPDRKSRLFVTGALFILFSLTTLYVSLSVLNVALFVYMGFGIIDMAKAYKKESTDGRIAETEDPVDISAFKEKPNIYLLFLESMHPKAVLEDIYGSDDFGLSQYLIEKDFLVLNNFYSNAPSTRESFCNIFGMTHCRSVDKIKTLPAINVLKNNGYKVHFYDKPHSWLGDFEHFFDYTNFNDEGEKTFLFTCFAPLFELLPALGKVFQITGNFDGGTMFEHVYPRVDGVAGKQDGPYCCAMRFGAGHSPTVFSITEGVSWRDTWKKTYLDMYKTSVDHCRQMVDLLSARDPGACIIAVGDHGAHYYRWMYDSRGNIARTDNDVSHELVARDAFSVLMGVRYPGASCDDAFSPPCSHVNIFRRVFKMLGARGDFIETEEENGSRFGKIPFTVARDGVPLSPWEPDAGRPARVEDGSRKFLSHAVSLISEGNFSEAIDFLTKTLSSSDSKEEHIEMLTSVLFRVGKADAAEDLLLEQLRGANKDAVFHAKLSLLLARSSALQGKLRDAYRRLDAPLPKDAGHLKHHREDTLIDVALLARDLSRVESCMKQRSEARSFPFTYPYALFLRSIGRGRDAFEHLGKDFYPKETFLHALLALELGMPDQAAGALRTLTETMSGISLVNFLLLSGILEQGNKSHEAFAVLSKAYEQKPQNGLLRVALGTFLMRNRLSPKGLELLRREAYSSMKADKELLLANDFFDPDWYSSRYAPLLGGMEPMKHYLLYRNTLFLDPNPYFDCGYYAMMNGDAIASGFSPDRHFLLCLPFEERNPSPVFVTTGYINRHPEVLETNVNPLVHFIRAEGRGETGREKAAA